MARLGSACQGSDGLKSGWRVLAMALDLHSPKLACNLKGGPRTRTLQPINGPLVMLTFSWSVLHQESNALGTWILRDPPAIRLNLTCGLWRSSSGRPSSGRGILRGFKSQYTRQVTSNIETMSFSTAKIIFRGLPVLSLQGLR